MRLIDIFRTYSASVGCASIKVENKLKPARHSGGNDTRVATTKLGLVRCYN